MTLQGPRAFYNCSDGYILEGAESLTCQSNEQWSDSAPICVLQNQTDPETSTQSNLGVVVGSVVAVSVLLIIFIVILTVIVCCVRRYLKRELEVPTMGPESIEFSKIRR